jgi:hypothetical protein
MKPSLRTVPWDLRAVALLALVGLLATAVPLPSALRLVLLLPLVLVLPGYAIASATFPRPLPPSENLVYSLAFSLCTAILGGVLVQVLVPLTPSVWALLLTGLTLLAVAVAAVRRNRQAIGATPLPSLPWIGFPAVVLFALAIGVAGWSVILATDGAHDQADAARFTSLWMVPRAAEDGGGAVVGVENQQGAESRYQLLVRARGEKKERRIPLELDDGEVRTIELGAWATPSGKGTVAKLYRDGRLHRQVRLSAEAAL